MTDIIVAKYKEDITWINNFKKSKIFIYDKSDEINEYIKLPNVGREAHTYLTHIVNNYETLSNNLCFLQGNPFDGHKGHLNKDFDFIENFNQVSQFIPLSYTLRCNLDGTPHHPNLDVKELIFDRFFINQPEYLDFVVGAQFIVSRDLIYNRKRDFYVKLISEFERTDIDNSHTGGGGGASGNKMPWIMERIWYYIFNPQFKSKFDT